ncbi:MAG: hypothetical protein HQL63_16185 [Magnetococcales bacterium]|nr:hypothetical protein [Magnetococcales bacterium]
MAKDTTNPKTKLEIELPDDEVLSQRLRDAVNRYSAHEVDFFRFNWVNTDDQGKSRILPNPECFFSQGREELFTR